MGRKVHPIGFRLNLNKNWEGRWFAKGKAYREPCLYYIPYLFLFSEKVALLIPIRAAALVALPPV